MKTSLFCLGALQGIVLLGLSGSGCEASDPTTLILSISELSNDIRTLRLTATMADTQTVKEYDVAPMIGLQLPQEASGQVDVLVSGLGDSGCLVASAEKSFQVSGEPRIAIDVPLVQCSAGVDCCSQICKLDTTQKCGGGPCRSESDRTFCARITNACESHTAMDNCGMQRTVDCGGCTGYQGCVVGTCKTPVCTTFNYTSAPISTFTRADIEDSLAAATPDGQVILYIKSGSICGGPLLIVADQTSPGSGVFTLRDVTSAFGMLGLSTDGDGYTITADGLTIITRSTDSKRLLSTKRSALNGVDFGPPLTTDFDPINGQVVGSAGTFHAPAISADGLELFYTISGVATSTDGIYSSVRSSTSVPFPAGAKIKAAMPYPIVTGVSSDRLALFVFDAFQGRVLTRNSTSHPFTNPNAPGDPSLLPNWQHKPLADCSKLVAIMSPGGCQNQDIVLMTRQ